MTDFKDKDYRVFELFQKQWALATAGTPERFNSCTIGWGSLGTLWATKGRSGAVVTVYLHPSRYTCDFFKESDYFTVSFFPEGYRKALAYMGSHSGRDGDKVPGSGLSPKLIYADGYTEPAQGLFGALAAPTDLGGTESTVPCGMTYDEAELSFLCRKLYQGIFDKDGLARDIKDYYGNAPKSFPPDEDGEWQPHVMFVGEIVGVEDSRG